MRSRTPFSRLATVYPPAAMARLRAFISSSGGIERAAEKLDIHSMALHQVLHNEPVPNYVRQKIEVVLGSIVQSEDQIEDSNKDKIASLQTLTDVVDPLLAKLQHILGTEISVLDAASKLNVNPSTIRKILSGARLSPPIRKKLVYYLQSHTEVPSPNTLPEKRVSLQTRLKEIIRNESDLLDASSRWGINVPTLRRAFQGKDITPRTEHKILAVLDCQNPMQLNVSKPSRSPERLTHVYQLYKELGTLQKVGQQIGVTRQRVRQLLVQGSKLGLFHYQPYEYPYIPKEKLVADYTSFPNFNEVARINHISTSYLHKLLSAYSVTEENLVAYRKEGKRLRCIQEYKQLEEKVGHHLTTTEFQSTSKGHALHNQIIRLWGSIDAFRAALNIPKPRRRYPEWLEPRRRLAFIVRMNHLDTLRECLSASNPKSISEISADSSFRPIELHVI